MFLSGDLPKQIAISLKHSYISRKGFIYRNIKEKCQDCQLIEDERVALIEWRKNNLFNKSSNLVMRLQDKGKRFVVVDKETDRNKAQEQIDKTFVEDVRSRPN